MSIYVATYTTTDTLRTALVFAESILDVEQLLAAQPDYQFYLEIRNFTPEAGRVIHLTEMDKAIIR